MSIFTTEKRQQILNFRKNGSLQQLDGTLFLGARQMALSVKDTGPVPSIDTVVDNSSIKGSDTFSDLCRHTRYTYRCRRTFVQRNLKAIIKLF